MDRTVRNSGKSEFRPSDRKWVGTTCQDKKKIPYFPYPQIIGLRPAENCQRASFCSAVHLLYLQKNIILIPDNGSQGKNTGVASVLEQTGAYA